MVTNGLQKRPLIVDLDGTLVRTDLLIESAFILLKRNIFFIFLLPFWLIKGKAHLKHQISVRVDIQVELLPYHNDFLTHLRAEHDNGRRLILATASNKKFAEAIAQHLGVFDDVLASDDVTNLSGRHKLERLQNNFSNHGFDYAANAMIDLPVWQKAHEILLVNPMRGVKEVAERQGKIVHVFDDRKGSLLTHYLKALRLHQWLKNLLLFVPLLMAHQFDEPALVGQTLLAFLAFGLCASSVYLLNDLLDLPDDRRHPTKHLRPLALGSIPIVNGVVLIPALLLGAFLTALLLPVEFIGILVMYYGITLLYSLRLKREALVDVLTLASLYTIRIIAGAAAISILPSFWLLAFSMFLFLSLALVKRYTELSILHEHEKTVASGRGYDTTDLETLSQFGTASAYMAILVLALYINSETIQSLYARPEIIWLLCPLLLYIVMRVWLLARRGKFHEDPVVFMILDRHNQWLAGISLILLWLAA